ncbi:TRAP transporter small permease subunit [Bauldia litoralis]|uniref:TRAP transporter small permease protein n=1 Tax=Bauldia litoralis TaxID=665467 RepID=A0A1G6DHM6_9HYPH|nr:TRAP transporter small permease [Bauldia litoralis]SDB44664.1 TRAP-type mannitol/chloroaromatic compound transport system, small permease component [Bauldia litoralis]
MVEHERTGWMDWISIAISRVAMFLVPFIVLIMFYEVVRRYIFEKPTLWVNEMSLWIGGVIYLLAGLYVMQQRGHIRMFILYDIVPRPVQKVFDIISTLLICLFAAAIVWGGYNEAVTKFFRWETFGTAWDPPIPATIKPLILITVVLIGLQSISNLIRDWHKGKIVHEIADEVAIDMLVGDAEKSVITGETADTNEKK